MGIIEAFKITDAMFDQLDEQDRLGLQDRTPFVYNYKLRYVIVGGLFANEFLAEEKAYVGDWIVSDRKGHWRKVRPEELSLWCGGPDGPLMLEPQVTKRSGEMETKEAYRAGAECKELTVENVLNDLAEQIGRVGKLTDDVMESLGISDSPSNDRRGDMAAPVVADGRLGIRLPSLAEQRFRLTLIIERLDLIRDVVRRL